MNKQAILDLANKIEALPRDEFDMYSPWRCIAGHLFDGEIWHTRGVADKLGLSWEQAEKLAFPGSARAYHATPKTAAKVLRRLAETVLVNGEPQWDTTSTRRIAQRKISYSTTASGSVRRQWKPSI